MNHQSQYPAGFSIFRKKQIAMCIENINFVAVPRRVLHFQEERVMMRVSLSKSRSTPQGSPFSGSSIMIVMCVIEAERSEVPL